MNRQLPFLLLAAATMLSCSSSKHVNDPIDPDNPNEPDPTLVSISFGGNGGTWQDAPSSRSTQRANNSGKTGLESLFSTFRVWGYKTSAADLTQAQTVMDGYRVLFVKDSEGSTDSNTDGWEYVGVKNPKLASSQTIKYWDFSATSYRFFGYSPFDDTEATIKTEGSNLSFTIPFKYSEKATASSIPYASNLWIAKASDNSSSDETTADDGKYGSCVTLTFSPIIAKVRFRFSYPDGTEDISIKDIKFCDSRYIDNPTAADTPLQGNITTSYPLTGNPPSTIPEFSWETATSNGAKGVLILTTPYEEKDATIHIIPSVEEYAKWYYLPPMAAIPYEQGPYTITARINGNLSAATVPAAYMQWKAGYQYTYIFKITEAGTVITFTDLQVEEWLPGSKIDNNGNGTEGW